MNMVYTVSAIVIWRYTAALKAMPKSNKVTAICNGKREIRADYEETKERVVKDGNSFLPYF